MVPLSRLSYMAYLVHPIVIYYYYLTLEQTFVMTEFVYVSTILKITTCRIFVLSMPSVYCLHD